MRPESITIQIQQPLAAGKLVEMEWYGRHLPRIGEELHFEIAGENVRGVICSITWFDLRTVRMVLKL